MKEFFGYVLANLENVDRRINSVVKQNRRAILLAVLCYGAILIQDKRMKIMDKQLDSLNQKLNAIQKEEDKE